MQSTGVSLTYMALTTCPPFDLLYSTAEERAERRGGQLVTGVPERRCVRGTDRGH